MTERAKMLDNLNNLLSSLVDNPPQNGAIKEMINSSSPSQPPSSSLLFGKAAAPQVTAAAAAAGEFSPPRPASAPVSRVQQWTNEEIRLAIERMVRIEPREAALAYANAAAATTEHRVVWTDASWHDREYAGVAVVFQQQQHQQQHQRPWVDHGYTILPPVPKGMGRVAGPGTRQGGTSSEIRRGGEFCFETLGISLGLERAAEQVVAAAATADGGNTIQQVTLFCDNSDAIWEVREHLRSFFLPGEGSATGKGRTFGQGGYGSSPQAFRTGCKSTQLLWDHGVFVNLRWCPAHEGVPGNERADQVARLAARYGCLISPFPQITSADFVAASSSSLVGAPTASASSVFYSGGVVASLGGPPSGTATATAVPSDQGKGKRKATGTSTTGSSSTGTGPNPLPTPPASDGEEAAEGSKGKGRSGGGKRRKTGRRGGGAEVPDDSMGAVLAKLRGSGQLEATSTTAAAQLEQQQQMLQPLPPPPPPAPIPRMGIMRLPVPVLEAIAGVVATSTKSAGAKWEVSRRIVELLKRTGREEGWIVEGHEF